MVELGDANIFSGTDMGAIGFGLLIFVISIVIVGMIGFGIYVYQKLSFLFHLCVDVLTFYDQN